jgi:hypothetical protein
MARQRLESLFNDFKRDVHSKIDRLSKQVKIYGAVVTLGAVAIPVYGQIQAAWAQDAIEKTVDRRIDVAVSKAADASAERAIQKFERRYEQATPKD